MIILNKELIEKLDLSVDGESIRALSYEITYRVTCERKRGGHLDYVRKKTVYEIGGSSEGLSAQGLVDFVIREIGLGADAPASKRRAWRDKLIEAGFPQAKKISRVDKNSFGVTGDANKTGIHSRNGGHWYYV